MGGFGGSGFGMRLMAMDLCNWRWRWMSRYVVDANDLDTH